MRITFDGGSYNKFKRVFFIYRCIRRKYPHSGYSCSEGSWANLSISSEHFFCSWAFISDHFYRPEHLYLSIFIDLSIYIWAYFSTWAFISEHIFPHEHLYLSIFFHLSILKNNFPSECFSKLTIGDPQRQGDSLLFSLYLYWLGAKYYI